jgi:hypothetical protein
MVTFAFTFPACGGRSDSDALARLHADGSLTEPDAGMGDEQKSDPVDRPADASTYSDPEAAARPIFDAAARDASASFTPGADASDARSEGHLDASDARSEARPDARAIAPDCSAGFIPDAFDPTVCPILSSGLCFSSKEDVCACLACDERCILQFAICGGPCSFPASARCVCATYPRC